ncbi:hypothetical protein KY285_019160 [Solanum tuberosum]|nr:hypothetical protein KY289_022179 [Solanum tuberosum]KAH0692063.1 hypothetical protein KY285_019160 [Solanum tuberosum]
MGQGAGKGLKVKANKFKKKKAPTNDTFSAFVYFESNLVEVPNNIWWLDSGATTHVSTMLHGFTTIQTTNPNKDFLFMRNCMKAQIEGMGTY